MQKSHFKSILGAVPVALLAEADQLTAHQVTNQHQWISQNPLTTLQKEKIPKAIGGAANRTSSQRNPSRAGQRTGLPCERLRCGSGTGLWVGLMMRPS